MTTREEAIQLLLTLHDAMDEARAAFKPKATEFEQGAQAAIKRVREATMAGLLDSDESVPPDIEEHHMMLAAIHQASVMAQVADLGVWTMLHAALRQLGVDCQQGHDAGAEKADEWPEVMGKRS